MTVLFYLFALVALYYEMCQVIDTQQVIAVRTRLNGLTPEIARTNPDGNVLVYALFMMLYFIWAGVGLLSSQWPFFLALFVVSFIPKKDSTIATRVDGILSAAILILMILNKFHFKYEFNLSF